MAQVTIFRNIKDTANPVYIDHIKILERIKSGKHKESIELIRAETDKHKRNELKQKLPSILFSGKFRSRKADAILEHSGLITLDFDNIPKSKMKEIRTKLIEDQYVHALFVSPGGEGYKVLVKILPEADQHKAYFDGLSEHFASEYFDKNTSDVSRVCYESYDKNLYYNENSTVFTHAIEREQFKISEKKPDIMLTNQSAIFEKLLRWMEKQGEYFVSGNRNHFCFKLASASCRYGIDEHACKVMMRERFVESTFNESELSTCVDQGYKANRDQFGSEYFEDNTIKRIAKEIVRSTTDPKIATQKLSEAASISPEQAEQLVKSVAKTKSSIVTEFWTKSYNKAGNVSVKVNRGDYIEWLHSQGVYRYRLTTDKWVLIHIRNNIVSIIGRDQLKAMVFDYIKDDEAVYEYFASIVRSVFSDDILELLEAKDVDTLTDDPKEVNFYYTNKIVTISKQGIKFSDYDELDGCIWESQIINREYHGSNNINSLDEGNTSDFARFIFNVAGTNAKRFSSMRSVIGFLLHNYKSRAKCPAIILNDEMISDNPEGGTGKGIFIRSLAQFKKSEQIDGKSFKFDKSFLYQRVNLDTKILAFEDVQQGFDFERLFSVITDGMEIEKKNQGAFYLTFEQSPKIILTTNYAIRGFGNSFKRRKFELEFSQHYNEFNTPYDEFGKQLFDDWNQSEWGLFDKFMLGCAWIYINHGLIEADYVNLEYKKLIVSTCQEFVDYMDSKSFTRETPDLERSILRAEFLQENDDNINTKRYATKKNFAKWVDIYFKHHNIEYVLVKTNGIYYYRFN